MMQKSKIKITANWLRDPAVRKLMAALNCNAEKPQALFVGGCVRNAVLGIDGTDIDIATKHTPQMVGELCKAAGIRTIPTGIDHGTITAVIEKQNFEITTLRKDVATDGRRAVIAFADTWEDDAARRDFTMNTLLADGEGNIYDPLGNGIEDLQARRVIFVGDPSIRIEEDILRILRFFRFHAYYGEGEPDRDALSACQKHAHRIPELSRERITQEMFKILQLKNPRGVLELMFSHKVMEELSGIDLNALERLCTLQAQYAEDNLPARLSLFPDRAALDKLILLPKAIKNDMKAIENTVQHHPLATEHEIKTAIYRQGRHATMQALFLNSAEIRQEDITLIQTWDIPKFPTTGNDLIKKGAKPGPELGEELRALEDRWIEDGF